MRKFIYSCLVVCCCFTQLHAQQKPLSQQMAATTMTIWKDSMGGGRWMYDQGVVLKGIEGVWMQTADAQYFKYIQRSMDRFVTADGTIQTYKAEDYNLDNVLCGRSLLMLYKVLGADKYRKAAALLREQLKTQPRVPEGGFWHKKKYTNQMWLDGLYMAEPFYAEYAATFHEDAAFDDIANQFILMEQHARDPKTGLLYHAWDQTKTERWADPNTGLSKNFWGRAMGWYAMALVDVLDNFPAHHPKRAQLLAILNRLAIAIQKYQDPKNGLWYQVLDKATSKGNYQEASASCMFVYALAKGARCGYLPSSYLEVAKKGYQGIMGKFIETGSNDMVNLNGTVSVAGLGGKPYRDGSYEYYLSEKVVQNDPKGVGAFLLASVEVERLAHIGEAKGKTVLLDSYFNSETRKDVTGKIIPFHYKWDELSNNGFSLFGHIFDNYGFKKATLEQAPDAANLKKADVFIIVDPDIPKENPNPNYIEAPHVKAISEWVKDGGVLLVFNNDTGNAEFNHLNKLMAKFGMQFNLNSRNHVEGSQFEQGAIMIPANNQIFKEARKIYVKEISTLNLTAPAKPALEDKGDVIIAVAKYGKGTVFAVGDPWFYNEYLDGRKLPPSFENFTAANDLVKWVVKQLPAGNKK
ncbi:glycoside hydrolase family 88 protein [Mucilaginibacter sp. RS28]|uniref:Glycoside hydrolase family 88 protein n=1 Tax=Mucilaginibacter straminoryzae TaxID=2932774 RepID=A0A9X1WZI6_9SPHI|nr:glycoside hydrolase family 88 protein [Mucilaginibacter straminoryzae]MCJ8208512.1 glycoside hydrolase family 88 protein [Mucilaginibacter straminoryzae]